MYDIGGHGKDVHINTLTEVTNNSDESYTPPRLYTVKMDGGSLYDVSEHGKRMSNGYYE